MSGNDRLRCALAAQGITTELLAERVGVDVKTSYRWVVKGTLPYPAHRRAVAAALTSDEAYLWPESLTAASVRDASSAELVAFYPDRAAVPAHLWTTLIGKARQEVNVLVYAGRFLFDTHPGFCQLLISQAQAGVRVRLAFGDPDSPQVAARGIEEGLDMALQVRAALDKARSLFGVEGIEVRLHATTLYASIYRADDDLLTNGHVYGAQAATSPVLHLRRLPGGQAYRHYAESFEGVWATARPIG